MSEPNDPTPAIAVSPDDRSSDRGQSDIDQAGNFERNLDDRAAANLANERAIDERETARKQAVVDQGITNERIDSLLESNERATKAAHEAFRVSEEQTAAADRFAIAMVEFQERAILARRRFRIELAVLLIVGALLYWRQDSQNQDVQDSLHAAQDARFTLLDCVVPGGSCYERGQVATTRAVTALSERDLINAVCAARYTHMSIPKAIEATRSCVAVAVSHQ